MNDNTMYVAVLAIVGFVLTLHIMFFASFFASSVGRERTITERARIEHGCPTPTPLAGEVDHE